MSKAKRVIAEYNQNKQEYLDNLKKEKTFSGRLKKRLPNILTKSRIVAPFLIVLASIIGNFAIATIIAGVFGLTDAFDGHLARKWHATSEYRRKLDIISDKMYTLGLILPLLIANPITILPTLILEFAISTINTRAELNNNHPKSSMLGKVKTTFLYVTLTALYLAKCFNLPINALLPLLGITNITQAITAVQYKVSNDKEESKKEVKIEEKKDDEVEPEDKISKIKQEIREYQQIKEDLLKEPEKEKEFVKRIEK